MSATDAIDRAIASIGEAIKLVEALPDVAVTGGWQRIETAPRDPNTQILTWDGQSIEVATYAYDDSWWHLGDPAFDPTHWMPLPKPPVSA